MSTPHATSKQVLSVFATVIYAKARALKSLTLSDAQRARLLESVSDDIKKCTDLIQPEVSRAARREAQRRGIDLYGKGWHDQPGFDKRRRIFHLEHFTPVSAIRAACLDQRTRSGVLKVLISKLRVVWLLKSEDAILTRQGHRTKRDDPAAAYKAAGIRVVGRG